MFENIQFMMFTVYGLSTQHKGEREAYNIQISSNLETIVRMMRGIQAPLSAGFTTANVHVIRRKEAVV
jgi:hypothetical protein